MYSLLGNRARFLSRKGGDQCDPEHTCPSNSGRYQPGDAGTAVHYTILGFFAVLDGSRKADSAADPGDYFELRHVHGTSEDVLSGPKGDPLHELL
jgi:hypothetical protein